MCLSYKSFPLLPPRISLPLLSVLTLPAMNKVPVMFPNREFSTQLVSPQSLFSQFRLLLNFCEKVEQQNCQVYKELVMSENFQTMLKVLLKM